MGIMDQARSVTRPQGSGDFLGADERHQMVETGQPFNIVSLRRGSSKQYDKFQWFVDLEFIDPRTGNLIMIEDTETGEEKPIRRVVTFNASDSRDKEYPVLEKMRIDAGGSLGPLKMVRVAVKGQANPAYIFEDWTPNGAAPAAPVQTAPSIPPVDQPITTPDGKFVLIDGQWVPTAGVPPPPPEPPAVVDANIPSFSKAAGGNEGPDAAKLPPLGVSQPLPEVASVETGGDGEGGQTSVVRYKGDQIRQAVFHEGGVVQTPSGGLVQAVRPEEPKPVAGQIVSPDGKFFLKDGQWSALPPLPGDRAGEEGVPVLQTAAEARTIAQEATDEPTPTEGQEPVQAAATAVPAAQIPANEKPKRTVIPMRVKCDYCKKTVQGQAFKNSKGIWIITHTCEGLDQTTQQRRGATSINVDEQVKSLLAEAANA